MSNDDSGNDLKHSLLMVPYFSKLDSDVIELIAKQTRLQEYDTDQVVFWEGEQDVALYIVYAGWLKAVKMSLDGREQILHFIGPGEVFNAIGVFVENANPATIIALEPAMLWVIQQNVMLKLFDDYPHVARNVVRCMAERVQHLVDLVEDLSLRTIEARLARYLIEESTEEQLQRPRWATQSEIANRLGTVPDVLNRALRNLANDRLIHVERHQIRILDYRGLEMKAKLDK